MSYTRENKRPGEDIKSEIENRMLTGVPFTYGGLCDRFRNDYGIDCDRTIDQTIQRLRKQGKIAFKREGRNFIWCTISKAKGEGK